MNAALYRRGIAQTWKVLVIIAVVLTMYTVIIIGMYNPTQTELLNQFIASMPDVMNSLGMKAQSAHLIAFIISYLYGMLLLIFPMVFTVISANTLVSKHIDQGSMVTLLAAPIKRRQVMLTQITVLISEIALLVLYLTALEITVSQIQFPGQLEIGTLLVVNLGLFGLQSCIAGISILCSAIAQDSSHALLFSAGVPTLMYVVQMMANLGGNLKIARYFTMFSLYSPDDLVSGQTWAAVGVVVLFTAAIVLFVGAVRIFNTRDLNI
ncbi:ABC transporter permease subunit [Bifidobacterium sp.]|jgi:ABC-2 type transport system permease protein|uniref:ABC transporter permease subunit n=1 Tax=Bifidobacterium sp. TaxID=41200 RepID=UPI0025B8E83E|nr:ABC transporter permease subunit [Bifidobacterium sp.]MCI1635580.1 ABC transporter permease [Bifidobacterium sp.]